MPDLSKTTREIDPQVLEQWLGVRIRLQVAAPASWVIRVGLLDGFLVTSAARAITFFFRDGHTALASPKDTVEITVLE